VRLAVLSACETGLPGLDTIDEVVSLPIGMLQAGVAGVVASLWPVDDRSTMMLMVRFYDLWREQQLEPSEALRQAQQWIRDTPDEEKAAYYQGRKFILDEEEIPECKPSHPSYWSAFTYTGV
jgi:CHAT domain-containing protein